MTEEEAKSLRSQIATSKNMPEEDGKKGGRRYLPYVFTEQGIAMLSAVLRSDVAVQVSISIMKSFVEMRRFMANNALLFERTSNVELKQLEYQKQTDEKLEQIFEYISEHEETNQKVFFDGQIYDAFSLIVSLIQKAEKEITLIDGYVDIGTLNLLAKKNEGVSVTVYTHQRTRLSNIDVTNDIFAENAWYFRNSLVRANYNDLKNGIHETTEYLEIFLRNLLLNESHPLHNRTLHVSGEFKEIEKPDIEKPKPDIEALKADIEKIFQPKTVSHILKLRGTFSDQAVFGRSDVMKVIDIKASRTSDFIKELAEHGIIEPVSGHGKGKYRFR